MRRITTWTFATAGLALLHTFPARHHFGEWNGIGAAVAIVLLALPFEHQARMVAMLERSRLMFVALMLLVIAHRVPAADHVPKLLAQPNFADAWRAVGSCGAIAWFASPRAFKLAVVRALTRAGAFRGARLPRPTLASKATARAR
jgi:uncharacterized membrane protein AbrB (regulator of aidB expression)